MTPFWIVLSTVCVWSSIGSKTIYLASQPSLWMEDNQKSVYTQFEPYCIQQAKISFTEPELEEGEFAYQTMPSSHVAIPKKVWDKIFRLAYWQHSANTYEDFEKLLDEVEGKKSEPYYPHIHRWQGPYPETLQWEKCHCGKRRRKVTMEKWVMED